MPCPPLSSLSSGVGGMSLKWSIKTVKQYKDCQDKNARLIQAWPKK